MAGEAVDAGGGLPAVVELFRRACESFGRALVRSDEAVLDATDFAGSLHELGITAGRVRALGEALTLITGDPAWTRQAEEVLAEYMQATALPEDEMPAEPGRQG
jgi:hypothetical protein